MLDIRSLFHIFTNILLHFTCTCITEFFFFFFGRAKTLYIVCIIDISEMQSFSYIYFLWHSMTMQ